MRILNLNGEIRWEKNIVEEFKVTTPFYGFAGSPVIYGHEGKRYAAVSSYKGLYSVEAETGKPLWVYEWEKFYSYFRSQVTDPLIFNNRILSVGCKKTYFGSVLLNVGGNAWRAAVVAHGGGRKTYDT